MKEIELRKFIMKKCRELNKCWNGKKKDLKNLIKLRSNHYGRVYNLPIKTQIYTLTKPIRIIPNNYNILNINSKHKRKY